MRRSRGSWLVVALACCGPPHVFHKDPERACEGELAIAAREDVARLSGCTRAGTLRLRPAGPLEVGGLARLEVLEGDLVVGPTVGFERLALPRLREVRGTLRVSGNGDLHSVALPALARARRIEIEGNLALRSLALPALATTDAVVIADNAELAMLELSGLGAVAELAIANNPNLTVVEAPSVKAGQARIEANRSLPDEVADRLRGE
jgi:hypothetical protein